MEAYNATTKSGFLPYLSAACPESRNFKVEHHQKHVIANDVEMWKFKKSGWFVSYFRKLKNQMEMSWPTKYLQDSTYFHYKVGPYQL